MGLCEIRTTPETAYAAQKPPAGVHATQRAPEDQGSGLKTERSKARLPLDAPAGFGDPADPAAGPAQVSAGEEVGTSRAGCPRPPHIPGVPQPTPQPLPDWGSPARFSFGGGACTVGLGAGTYGPGHTAAPRPRRARTARRGRPRSRRAWEDGGRRAGAEAEART